jgi:hypothetical protein
MKLDHPNLCLLTQPGHDGKAIDEGRHRSADGKTTLWSEVRDNAGTERKISKKVFKSDGGSRPAGVAQW